MFADFQKQSTYSLGEYLKQKLGEFAEHSIDKLSTGKQTQKILDFNNHFRESQSLILYGKKNETFPFLMESLQITHHCQIKNLQQIILPGSLIGCFSNFPSKNVFSFANLLEIGQDKELYGLKNIRSFALDGIIIQEWDASLLQQLMGIQQRFYFYIKNAKQLHNFVQDAYQTRSKEFIAKKQISKMSTSLLINIFPIGNQIFLVQFQIHSQKQQKRQLCSEHQTSLFQSQELLQNLVLDLKLNKTLETCAYQQSNKFDSTGHQRDQFSSEEETAVLQSCSQRSDQWIIDASFFSETQNEQDLQSSIVKIEKKDQLCDFQRGFYNSNEWVLHKIDIYNGIDGEDNREVIFCSSQIPKKYARSVCSYQELQSMKKDLQESFELEEEMSDF